MRERFYWPSYEVEVNQWVRECQECQRKNSPQPLPQAELETIKATYPFQKLSWDTTGPLPITDSGHKYILVVTDIFSKWVEAFPLKGTDAHTLAVVLVNEIVCRYGVPSVIHSDQGANFCSEVIQSLCNLLGIERTQTSAYHPQGNGQVERFNRTLKNMLAKVTQQNQKDWDVHLPRVLFAYRTSIHESTGFSPYYINFGRSPTLPVDVMLGRVSSQDEVDQTMPQYVQQVCQSLKEAYTTARQRISITQRRRKEYKDRTATASPQLQIGDRVWLYVPAVKTGRNRKHYGEDHIPSLARQAL